MQLDFTFFFFSKSSTDETLIGGKEHIEYEKLYNAIERSDMKQVNEILTDNPDATKAKISSHGDTALHVAILSGKMKIALMLVGKMHKDDLEICNEFGASPLSLAAITENIELAEAMVQKNENLVRIKKGHKDESSLPIIVASMYGRKKMVKYLYSKTPMEILDPANGSADGVLLLNNLITADLFGVFI